MAHKIKLEDGSTKVVTTQAEKVLDYLQTHEYITDKIAVDLFHAHRLSAIIFNIRKKHDVMTRMVTGKNYEGITTTYAEYVLMDK